MIKLTKEIICDKCGKSEVMTKDNNSMHCTNPEGWYTQYNIGMELCGICKVAYDELLDAITSMQREFWKDSYGMKHSVNGKFPS
jgi:hypothetical protein